MDNLWNSSGRISQDSPQWEFSIRFNRWWENDSVNARTSQAGTSSCRMLNGIVWDAKGNDSLCVKNSKTIKEYAEGFPRGHWSFLGFGTVMLWQDYCGNGNLRKFYQNTYGNLECLFVNRETWLFLSVYVDDIKLAGKKQNISPTWKILMKDVDLWDPTSFFGHVYLGCTQRECTIRNDIVTNCRDMFESRISASDTKIVRNNSVREPWCRNDIIIVLWYGRSRKEMRGKTLRTCKQNDWAIFQSRNDCVWEIQYRIITKTILQEKVKIHYNTTIWFTNLFLCLKLWKFRQRKQRWTRNGKNWRKFRRGTWRKSKVRIRWSMKQGRRALQFILHH